MKPKAGERFRALRDTSVRGVITLKTPASGGFVGTLPRGEIVTIEMDPPSHASAVYARPEHYEEIARLLVPQSDLASPLYGSYALVISFDSLEQDFEVVTSFGFRP
jgi:hypothetical protein